MNIAFMLLGPVCIIALFGPRRRGITLPLGAIALADGLVIAVLALAAGERYSAVVGVAAAIGGMMIITGAKGVHR